MKFRKMELPVSVQTIAKVLDKYHFQAYLVGGAVRDFLLGNPAKDYDIATDATPKEIMDAFEKEKIKSIPTGEKFGTITILIDDVPYEVTTFRNESDYEDFRRPSVISFSKNIEDDLSRRDLTINSMALHILSGEMVDPFGGQEDLQNGVIKAVGRAEERFHEDALRLMRAVRFATRYNFDMDEDTKKAIVRNAERIRYVSAERIKKELDGILLTTKPSVGLQLLHDLGLLKIILPEVDILDTVPQQSPWHHKNVWGHTLDVVDASPARIDVRWTTLLHDTGKAEARQRDETGRDRFIGHDKISAEIAERVLRRFKFDNSSIKKIVKLILLHQAEPIKRNKIKHFLRHLGTEHLEDWKAMRYADIVSHNPDKVEHGLSIHNPRLAEIDDILAKKEPYDIAHLAVTGDDLKKAGVPAGPIMGILMRKLLELVITNPAKNNKATLTQWAKNNWQRVEKESR